MRNIKLEDWSEKSSSGIKYFKNLNSDIVNEYKYIKMTYVFKYFFNKLKYSNENHHFKKFKITVNSNNYFYFFLTN